MYYALLFTLITLMGFPSQSHSEIEKIVLKWKPGFCSESCLVDLERKLNSIPDIAELKFQGAQSQATIRWKPNRSFSYGAIDRAMRYVGVNLREIFITVRGTIDHTTKEVTVESLGDNTKIILLSPITITSGEAAVEKNIQSHRLKRETRSQLVNAEDDEKIVKIEGPLFEPERSSPLSMIVERVTIPPSWVKAR